MAKDARAPEDRAWAKQRLGQIGDGALESVQPGPYRENFVPLHDGWAVQPRLTVAFMILP